MVDASVIFISTSQTYKTSPTWGFLLPFSNRLWGSILALVVAHGIVYYCADRAQRAINHRIKQARNPTLTLGALGGDTMLVNAVARGRPSIATLGTLGHAQDANVMPMEDEFEHENLASEGELEKSRGPLTFTRSVYASLLHFADGEPHQGEWVRFTIQHTNSLPTSTSVHTPANTHFHAYTNTTSQSPLPTQHVLCAWAITFGYSSLPLLILPTWRIFTSPTRRFVSASRRSTMPTHRAPTCVS